MSGLVRNLPVRLAGFCLLTVLVMSAHCLLPKRHRVLFPSPPFYVGVFADTGGDGQPLGRMVSQDPMAWECDVPAGAAAAPPCGLIVDLSPSDRDGADLSAYDQLLVDMSVSGGDRKLRFSFRNFMPGYSRQGDVDSMKFEGVYIPAGDIAPGLSIDFKEIKVADWWLDHNALPRNLVSPDFSHVALLAIDMASGAAPGRHRYEVRHIELAGGLISKENWYLGILIVWIAAIASGGVLHVLKVFRRQGEEGARYREISRRDHLTGLFNRHGAAEWIDSQDRAGSDGQSVLIIIDVDRFKEINDRYGHDWGDKVLRQVAEVLAVTVRSSDCLARWGGEEFLVYLPQLGLASAIKIAEKLRHAVEAHTFPALPGLTVTISLGVGQSAPAEPFDSLFERVDKALFRAKRRGRNRVEIAG